MYFPASCIDIMKKCQRYVSLTFILTNCVKQNAELLFLAIVSASVIFPLFHYDLIWHVSEKAV